VIGLCVQRKAVPENPEAKIRMDMKVTEARTKQRQHEIVVPPPAPEPLPETPERCEAPNRAAPASDRIPSIIVAV